ncbi:Bax inhibitor-1/YccA family protein [Wenzhouxiangella marina]|uniref:Putative TEGT family carrier/transport protein n=2 Tax=Wenzhouxiangella marina TaxID=1579979 RepID=A0A0K0XYG1_9GAMM|nr:Bax inhibitor-1/YccA family protein [Wenzhouxiangella marina]AKS42677.1 Putative TEGT family carrier/transport protein [Wenzhouxiangella marina]MBB6088634.1 modulator of FtsH protease [Wenzhouxiangella marina]
MNQPYRATSIPASSSIEVDEGARKVLRNTWNLLAMTLAFSAIMAFVSMQLNWPHFGLLTLVGYFGLLFLTVALRNSAWGLVAVFALTGFMGATLGPILSFYLSAFSNGGQIVTAAFGTTAVAFFGLSGFALVTKKDFSFLGPMLFIGIWVAFFAGLAAYFFSMPALSLAVSAMFALLMSGLILFQTQQIVRGGERNYIMATVTLFVSIYNLFTSLLHLFGFAFGEE